MCQGHEGTRERERDLIYAKGHSHNAEVCADISVADRIDRTRGQKKTHESHGRQARHADKGNTKQEEIRAAELG